MATRAAKATMDAIARKRMVAALGTLRDRFGLEMPAERPLVRDSEYAAITEREDMASILEGLVNATAPKPEPRTEPQPFAGAPGDYRPAAESGPTFGPLGAYVPPTEPIRRPVGRPRRSES